MANPVCAEVRRDLQHVAYVLCMQPCLSNHETLLTILQIPSGYRWQFTIHGLDFGIHAEKTGLRTKMRIAGCMPLSCQQFLGIT